ncbi:hypothetical protein H8S23_01770 [Anaerofilum sp. BX8]|uniref:DUF2178 domain-containing protein n=1 Tax=Anaerofilum hominis TaxID=2763016 RepID=A0A923I772_9FIRM|nr:hypothetical protein [Anaerofilum hominis]MBC5580227.1 hypothetical protein [Anaerofilum hominis]
MEQFKHKLARRVRLCQAGAILALIGFFVGKFLGTPDEFSSGFRMGVLLGLELCMAFLAIRTRRALCDEAALKELYIKETDERNCQIKLMVFSSGWFLLLFCLGLAILAASFFNFTVVFTLLGVLLCMCLLKLGCTIYYRQKY